LPAQDSNRENHVLFVSVGEHPDSVVSKMDYRRRTWLAVNIVEAAVYVPELSLDNILEYIQLLVEESGRVQSK
jgi:hypothetical protein